MAETVTIVHSTLSAGRNVIAGDPLAPVKIDNDTADLKTDEAAADLDSLLHNVDSDVNREVGGYFFDSIDDIFITGFLTPRDASEPGVRDGEYFFNVFECDIGFAEKLDLVSIHNYLRSETVSSPDAEFKPQLTVELNESTMVDTETSPHSLETVARIWDQYRRDDTPITAQLDEVSYFKSKIRGSLRKLNYIDTDSDNVSKFHLRSGDSPEFDEGQQGRLLKLLRKIDSNSGKTIQFDDLPSIEEEHRYFFKKELDRNVERLQEEIEYTDGLHENWGQFFVEEVEPLIEEHIREFTRLHRARVDPSQEVEQLVDEESGLIGRLTGGNDHQSPIKLGVDQETDRIVTELQDAISSRLEAEIERYIRDRAKTMLRQSDEEANEFSKSDAYQRYENIK